MSPQMFPTRLAQSFDCTVARDQQLEKSWNESYRMLESGMLFL